MTKKQKGGKIIASGGFGCIFKPALKCENSETRETNKISKLMTIKHANDEYNQIQKFKTVLNAVPNSNKYFLLEDFVLCKPDKLTNEDLSNYTKKCKPLKKKGITSKNINQSLDKILSLNMPDGGIDVKKFIDKNIDNKNIDNKNIDNKNIDDKNLDNKFTSSNIVQLNIAQLNIVQLNNSLIDLLINGILPMNKLKVFHCDIKDENVLVQHVETGLSARLIDWGLSIIHNSDQGIPRKLYRRPFQYNVPFSSVLFNKDFLESYNEFLAIYPNPDYFQIREFVVNYIFVWNEIRGPGHLSAINDIVKKLTIKELTAIKKNKIKEHLIEYDFTYYYIIEYLSQILKKYTHDGTFEMMTYFNTIFIKNIDIWGFVTIYISLYEHVYSSFETLNEYQMQFISKIKYIIIHFLYESPTEEIKVSSLVDELTKLNVLIEKFDIDHTSKKLEYLENANGGKIIKSKQQNKTKRNDNQKNSNQKNSNQRNSNKRKKRVTRKNRD